jgi:hypothetical protein
VWKSFGEHFLKGKMSSHAAYILSEIETFVRNGKFCPKSLSEISDVFVISSEMQKGSSPGVNAMILTDFR